MNQHLQASGESGGGPKRAPAQRPNHVRPTALVLMLALAACSSSDGGAKGDAAGQGGTSGGAGGNGYGGGAGNGYGGGVGNGYGGGVGNGSATTDASAPSGGGAGGIGGGAP